MTETTPHANPAPLGLFGFALTTVILSLLNANLLPDAGVDVVIPLALAFGGTLQLLACVMAFRIGSTFETLAFGSYGAFWWWFGLLELFAVVGWLDVHTATVGVTLVAMGAFTTYMWVGTFRLNWALWAVFGTLAVTFYLLGVGDWLGVEWLVVTGGYVGVLTALLAAYTSAAEVLNETFGERRVPLGSTPMSASSGPSAQSSD